MASLVAQLVRNPPAMQETLVRFLGKKDSLEKGQSNHSSPVFLSFTCGSAGKESSHNVGDLGSIPGLGTFPGEGKDTHSSILAQRIPLTVYPWGRKELDMTEQLSLSGEQAQVWFGNNILYGQLKLPAGIINGPISQITSHPSSFHISVVPLLVL